MKVGMMFHTNLRLNSLKYVARSLMEATSARYELSLLPAEYTYASEEQARRMSEEFVRSCDMLVGVPSERVMAARQRIGSDVPMVGFLLGSLSRGAHGLSQMVRYFNTNDVLLANCTADVELASKYFHNMQVRLLPFAFDEHAFHPLDAGERSAARERLGFREQDRIVLYAGRVTLEKNVHTLLRVFSAVQKLVPDACLVVAGSMQGRGSFIELGVDPLNLGATMTRTVSRLGIPQDRIRVLGPADAGRLRDLYNVADVKVNMTLNHDENFGLSQVEAMACGTPVVGTAWGGLRDTIVDDVSGYRVSTSSTPSGVKVNWWEAVNRIVSILQDPATRERFRESCARHAVEHYSQSRYEATLLEILSACREVDRPAEPIRVSDFAQEFWSVCNREARDSARYRRGRRAFELYQELMVPFTGSSPEHVPPGEELAPGHVLSLAAPVTADGEGEFRLNDPMYPFDVEVPPAYLGAFEAILAALREEPATTVERLSRSLPDPLPHVEDTLAWMLATGLLLRTRPVHGWVPPEKIDRGLGEPLFRIEHLDRAKTDFVVF